MNNHKVTARTARGVLGSTLALLSSTLVLSSCTLFNPYVRSKLLDCSSNGACTASKSVYAGQAASAIDAAEDQRARYFAAAGYQYTFNSVMGLGVIGLSADAIYKGVSSSTKSPNLPLTAVTAAGAGIYGLDVWLHNKPAESAYLVGFQAITCTMLRSRAILMTEQELHGPPGANAAPDASPRGFVGDTDDFEGLIKTVDAELSELQIAWDVGDEKLDVMPTEKADLTRELRNVEKTLAKSRKLLLTARAYAKEVESSGNTIRSQVNLIVANVSGQLAKSEPDVTALKGLLSIFSDPSKGVADLQAVTLVPTSPSGPEGASPATQPSSSGAAATSAAQAPTKEQTAAAAAVRETLTSSPGYTARVQMRQLLSTDVSKLYAAGRKLNSVLSSAQNFYDSTRKISACTPAGGPPALEIDPPSVKDPVSAGTVLKFSVSGGVGIPAVTLTGATGASADAKTQDLVVGVNGNSLTATVTILAGASGTLNLLATDRGTPAQQAKVSIDVEGAASAPAKPTFKVQAGPGSAQLTFTTPSAKGGTLSGYKVTLEEGAAAPVTLTFASSKQGSKSTGSSSLTGVISSETATETTIEITGLKGGEAYTVGLAATFEGAADLVFASASVTPAAPKAPAAAKPRVTPGNDSARVSFPTPAPKSGTLVGYIVDLSTKEAASTRLTFSSSKAGAQSSQSGTLVGKISSVAAGATTLSISGLTNGTTYTLSVSAHLEGAADEPVVQATPVTPAAPKPPTGSN